MNIFLAIPLLDELELLPQLLHDIEQQCDKDFTVVFCVNQPDNWWEKENKISICEANKECLKILQNYSQNSLIPIHIIDRSSHGKGWNENHGGVGYARRELMDFCIKLSENDNDIILSCDGDTHFEKTHISEVRKTFYTFPFAGALSIPFFHNPQGNEIQQKALLRYELFLRYLLINLLRINSPYAYSAIGSAMACTVKAYKRIGGIVPKISGEDFYFMQQLRKTGTIIPWCNSTVFPSSRISDRVLFGTGLAVSDIEGQIARYPFYDIEAFNTIQLANIAFGNFYENKDEKSKQIISETFPNIALEKLLKNHTSKERFVHACHEKADALAISKCLKRINSKTNSDTENLRRLFNIYPNYNWNTNFDFEKSTLNGFLLCRNEIFKLETDLLKNKYDSLSEISKNKKKSEWKYMI